MYIHIVNGSGLPRPDSNFFGHPRGSTWAGPLHIDDMHIHIDGVNIYIDSVNIHIDDVNIHIRGILVIMSQIGLI